MELLKEKMFAQGVYVQTRLQEQYKDKIEGTVLMI